MDEPWLCIVCHEEIDHEGYCDDCQPVVEDEDDGYCTYCAGTGEGRHDGASCTACGGKGFKWDKPEFDEDDYKQYRDSCIGSDY